MVRNDGGFVGRQRNMEMRSQGSFSDTTCFVPFVRAVGRVHSNSYIVRSSKQSFEKKSRDVPTLISGTHFTTTVLCLTVSKG